MQEPAGDLPDVVDGNFQLLLKLNDKAWHKVTKDDKRWQHPVQSVKSGMKSTLYPCFGGVLCDNDECPFFLLQNKKNTVREEEGHCFFCSTVMTNVLCVARKRVTIVDASSVRYQHTGTHTCGKHIREPDVFPFLLFSVFLTGATRIFFLSTLALSLFSCCFLFFSPWPQGSSFSPHAPSLFLAVCVCVCV